MRLPLSISTCLVILAFAAQPSLAQEGAGSPPQPNLLQTAPSQPIAPQADLGGGLPSLSSTASGSAQEGNVLPPASTAPAAAVPPAAPSAATAPSLAPALEGAVAAEGETTPAAPATPAAAPTPAAPADAAPPAAHTDLYSIVLSAHWVVLTVMLMLVAATFAVLVILIHKMIEYALAFAKLKRSARALAKAETLVQAEAVLRDHKGPAAEVVRAAAHEFQLAKADTSLLPGVRERTSGALSRIEASAAQRLRSATGILASIGSLSPFVGLFGTVFGIMNSFLAIAESKTTNLAIVAPGIAEALFATAIGLAAAIPAVLVYNVCSRKLSKYRNSLGDVSAAAERLQSRDLDRLAAALKMGV